MEQPTGTVTLLFTDIEGSTRLLQQLGRELYSDTLDLHDKLLGDVFERQCGYVVGTQGDSFFVAFARADHAAEAARAGQRRLASAQWPQGVQVRVRMGIHSGSPLAVPPSYVGLDVHRAARVAAAGHGGQVLVSQATRELLSPAVGLRDLGEHRLKDLLLPDRLYQLQIEGLPTDFPPLKTLDHRPTNLPLQPNSLVGRTRELEELVGLLRRDDVRLVTLTGTGGTGKTRLALQVGAELVEDYPDGVFFASLAAVEKPELVLSTLMEALGVRLEPERTAADTLRDYLREKQMLIVLDNFEQVVEAAPAVATLVASVRDVKVVATSRIRLHLAAEHVYAVEPLDVPDLGTHDVQTLTRNDAVALFVERAQAAQQTFTLTERNARAVAEICSALDGLPLAIELAAARITILSPEALVKRLGRRLALLTGGALDLPARQQTLRNAIQWSHDLLSTDEKRLFACLGVFAGGCRLDAAEAVAAGGADVLDTLASLVDKNLLRTAPDPDSEPRFWLLETIREYALEQLAAAGEEAELRRLHAAHFLTTAELAEPLLRGDQQAMWLDRLAADLDNSRAAMNWAAQNDLETALRLPTALLLFWYLRGLAHEGRSWVSAGLARAPDAPVEHCGRALRALGSLAEHEGDFTEAADLIEDSITMFKRAGDDRNVGISLNNLGVVAVHQGDWDRARDCFEASIAAKRRAGLEDGIAPNLSNLAILSYKLGDYERAKELHHETIDLCTKLGVARSVWMSNTLANLIEILLVEGNDEEARRRLPDVFDLHRELGDKGGLADTLIVDSRARLAGGDVAGACGSAAESLRLADELGDKEGLAAALEAASDVARALNHASTAVLLRATAHNLRTRIGAPLPRPDLDRAESTLAAARRALGDAAYDDAWSAGGELSTEDALVRVSELDALVSVGASSTRDASVVLERPA